MEKVAFYVQALDATSWLEKKVENPDTGRMVKVKSLSPELQKQYRPKNTGKMIEHINKFKKHLNKAKSLNKPALMETNDDHMYLDGKKSNMEKFLHHVSKAKHHVEQAKKHGFTESKESKAVDSLEKHVNSGDWGHEKLQHHIKQMTKHLDKVKPLLKKSEENNFEYKHKQHWSNGLTRIQNGQADFHLDEADDHHQSAKTVHNVLKKMNHPAASKIDLKKHKEAINIGRSRLEEY